jgi:festuclavine dehydrogenase
MPVARFVWRLLDISNPFQHSHEKVSAIYLVGPQDVTDVSNSVNSFIDYAVKEHGVKRFVMAGGTLLKKGNEREMEKVWAHLDDIIGVEYCVLRLTWFMGAPLVSIPS